MAAGDQEARDQPTRVRAKIRKRETKLAALRTLPFPRSAMRDSLLEQSRTMTRVIAANHGHEMLRWLAGRNPPGKNRRDAGNEDEAEKLSRKPAFDFLAALAADGIVPEIGRASCRERG